MRRCCFDFTGWKYSYYVRVRARIYAVCTYICIWYHKTICCCTATHRHSKNILDAHTILQQTKTQNNTRTAECCCTASSMYENTACPIPLLAPHLRRRCTWPPPAAPDAPTPASTLDRHVIVDVVGEWLNREIPRFGPVHTTFRRRNLNRPMIYGLRYPYVCIYRSSIVCINQLEINGKFARWFGSLHVLYNLLLRHVRQGRGATIWYTPNPREAETSWGETDKTF